MTTAIEAEWQPVNLSKYHAGQTVTPRVSRKTIRRGKKMIHVVRLRWYDAGDRSTTEVGEHRGDYWDCIEWLASHGVRIDDSRF